MKYCRYNVNNARAHKFDEALFYSNIVALTDHIDPFAKYNSSFWSVSIISNQTKNKLKRDSSNLNMFILLGTVWQIFVE